MFHPCEERIWVKRVLPKREDVEVSHLLSVTRIFHILHDLAFRNHPTHPVAFSVGVKSSIILPTPHAREAQFKPEELCLFLSQTRVSRNDTCYLGSMKTGPKI